MFGYIKLGAAVSEVRVADCRHNAKRILECIEYAAKDNVKLLVFPELSVSGYTCGDLFFQSLLVSECEKAVGTIAENSKYFDVLSVVGAPVHANGALYNCAIVLHGGKVLGIVPKRVLSEGGEFNEKRWFRSGAESRENSVFYCGSEIPFGNIIFRCGNYPNFNLAIEICADLWDVFPSSGVYSRHGATVITNPSASPAYAGKAITRAETVKAQSQKCHAVYVYCGSSIGESSADNVYDGQAIIADCGKIIAQSSRYQAGNGIITAYSDLEDVVLGRLKVAEAGETPPIFDIREVSFSFTRSNEAVPQIAPPQNPFVPEDSKEAFYEDMFNIQTFGLYKRLSHTGIKKTVLGVSGGLDSTLALLVAVNCHDKLELPRENVLGVTMPGFGTSGRTYKNAVKLMKELGITTREISIKDACIQHFKDIGHSVSDTGAAFENAQARERTQILMDIANMENGLVVGTGDMSELALGWATFGGDHMSMYGVNAGVPKTVARGLLGWLAEVNGGEVGAIIRDVIETPVSPELLPTVSGEISQKTEDILGPYELHDFFLYYAVHKCFSPEKTAFLANQAFVGVHDEAMIDKALNVFYKRFFASQFKRSCSPDYPKILEFGLSRSTDLKIPSDADGAIWMNNGDS